TQASYADTSSLWTRRCRPCGGTRVNRSITTSRGPGRRGPCSMAARNDASSAAMEVSGAARPQLRHGGGQSMGKPMRQPGRAAWRMGWALAALAALAACAGRADTQATETVTYQRELMQIERDLLYEGARAELEKVARASAARGTAAIPADR